MPDPTTAAGCLKAAMEALPRGDRAERDRLLDRSETLWRAENKASAIEKVLSVDFYVTRDGRAISSKRLAEANGVYRQ